MSYNALFVCAGNVGRSPLAEAIARRFLAQALGTEDAELGGAGIRVLSAGTDAPLGVQASRRGSALAEEIGVTIGPHLSQRVDQNMIESADVIYCMDESQVEHFTRLGFGGKAVLLDPDGLMIPDPRGRDLDFYREVRDHIVLALERRVPEILAAAGLD